MKKINIILIILMLFFVFSLNFFLIFKNDFVINPNKPFSFNSPFFATIDNDGNYLIIDNAQQRIVKVDKNKKIKFIMDIQKINNNNFCNASKIVIDKDNNFYVYYFYINENDELVEKDQIIKYDKNGNFKNIIVNYEYDKETREKINKTFSYSFYRIMSIKILDNNLYYYYLKNENKISLIKINLDNLQSEEIFDFDIEENIVNVIGYNKDFTYILKKDSFIYKLNYEKNLINKIDFSKYKENNNFLPFKIELVGIDFDRNNNLYIANIFNKKVLKIDNNYKIEQIFSDMNFTGIKNPIFRSIQIIDNKIVIIEDRSQNIILINNRGEIIEILNSLHYNENIIFLSYLFYFFIIIDIFILFFAGIYFYIVILKKKFPLLLKLILLFLPLLLLSIIITSYSVYNKIYDKYLTEIDKKITLVSQISAKIIDGDILEKIEKPSDYNNENYLRIKEQIASIVNDYQDDWFSDIYLLTYRYYNNMFYVAVNYSGSYGTMYPYIFTNEKYYEVIEKGELRVTEYYDVESSWRVAISPIYNSKKEIVGIAEVGFDSSISKEVFKNFLNTIIHYIIVIIIIFSFLIIIFSLFFIFSIRKLRDSITLVGNGNLSIQVKINTKDEIEDLAKGFNIMTIKLKEKMESLHDILIKLKNISLTSKNISQNLSNNIYQSSSAVEEMNAEMKSINEKFIILTNSINNSFINIKEIQKIINNVNHNIKNQTNAIEQSSSITKSMIESINKIIELSSKKKDLINDLIILAKNGENDMDNTLFSIKDIVRSVDSIFEMTSVIDEISDKINILAMNASIEAAHAGESGKGFAVVANEVRILAEATQENSKNINNFLKRIVEKIHLTEKITETTSNTISKIIKEIQTFSQDITLIIESLTNIGKNNNEIINSLNNLNKTSETLNDSSIELFKKSENIVTEVEKISLFSQENMTSIQEISYAIEDISKALEEISKMSDENSSNIIIIDEEIKKYNN